MLILQNGGKSRIANATVHENIQMKLFFGTHLKQVEGYDCSIFYLFIINVSLIALSVLSLDSNPNCAINKNANSG